MITIVHSEAISSTDANTATTSAVNTTGVTLIVVSVAVYQATPYVITDNKSNTYTLINSNTSGPQTSALWYCDRPNTGSGHTITISGASSFPVLAMLAASGTAPGAFQSQDSRSSGLIISSLRPGSVTPAEDGDLVVTGLGANLYTGSYAIDSGFSYAGAIYTGTGLAAAIGWLVQPVAAPVNPQWSFASNITAPIASIAVFPSPAVVRATLAAAAGPASSQFGVHAQPRPNTATLTAQADPATITMFIDSGSTGPLVIGEFTTIAAAAPEADPWGVDPDETSLLN